MAPFCRSVGSKADWFHGDALTEEQRRESRGCFLRANGEAGLSLWRANTPAEVNLALAAMMFARARTMAWKCEFKTFELLCLPPEEIERFGPIAAKPLTVPDVIPANPLHHELEWPQATLDLLADHAASTLHLAPVSYGRPVVKAAVRALSANDVAADARPWLAKMKGAAA